MRIDVEYTDTFAGEANYCWVRRHSFCATGLSDTQIMRKAKALVGLSGAKGRKDDMGDTIAFRPYRSCTVMFVTYVSE